MAKSRVIEYCFQIKNCFQIQNFAQIQNSCENVNCFKGIFSVCEIYNKIDKIQLHRYAARWNELQRVICARIGWTQNRKSQKKCAKNINQRHFVVASTIFPIYIYIWLHLTSLLTNFELKTFIGTNNGCNVRIAPKQYLNIFVHSFIRSFVEL